VELDKLEVLERETRSHDHRTTVTRASVRRSAGEVRPTVTARGKDGLVGPEAVQRSVLHVEGEDADALAVLHEQVERKVLDEEVGVVAERLAVECVKHSVARSVGGGGASVRLSTLAVVERLTTKGTLVDLALLGSREGETVVLELARSAKPRANSGRSA
jgi:hypothetical protein